MARTASAAAGLALAASLAAACSADVGISDAGTPAPSGSSAPSATTGGGEAEARAALAELRVAEEGDGAGYERGEFGVRWKDVDRNGCDQRNDILARYLENVRKRGDCVVVAGLLHDPYTGKEITFTKADAAEVQIDHVYPLALAWRMGASEWTERRREEFANDHTNLLAVWGVANGQKGDSGPGEWKPRKAYQCDYAIKYIGVAAEAFLPVTAADKRALDGFLDRC
ncbi:HNH endonuclease family protein [Actinomadura sp. WMMB 499]|uniref:HNH endonuclease family protein n=1 Tax=Actinomadura sp. WMMB 499 TaxID=1219491 RepID=UPI001247F53F|nr:HNH endonuclease family protein [Actinomadura sp. WMMB 499]QFG23927.1 HNH endonuclease [Actinomadura sp. WMMB 499]